MTGFIRLTCATLLGVLVALPARAQPPASGVRSGSDQSQTPQAAPQREGDSSETEEPAARKGGKANRALFADEGPVDTTWHAQIDSLTHALVRLPVAAVLSAMLAFRPRRRGTPKRQASVVQTQIILAIVGATVMLVVGASLARAFGIVGAAGLVRYRAKVEDPKDAGVMLSTLAIGLASGVGLYVFAGFAAAFVLGVLLVIESFDPEPYTLFDLTIATKEAAGMKEPIEGVLRRRHMQFELRAASPEELSYQVKLPMDAHTDAVSEALMKLKAAEPLNVKWEQKKAAK